jgi:hypothetical protein
VKSTVMRIVAANVMLLTFAALPVAASAWVNSVSTVANGGDVTYVTPGGFVGHPNLNTPADTPLHDISGGASLGVTWGQWQAATATTSKLRCNADGSNDVKVLLSGLIPNGLYSVFYRTFGPDSYNLLCPSEERAELVLTCPNGACKTGVLDSHVVADAKGNASLTGTVLGGCLLSDTQVFLEVIYHFDGHTYGQLPNKGEFQTQLTPCVSDADCPTIAPVCQPIGVGLACEPTTCDPNSGTGCNVYRGTFGEDAYRQVEITQKP